MKHIPANLVPALALLTLGGCTVVRTTTTTEPDGVYYSSKDRTTEIVTASTETGPADLGAATSSDDPNAIANPEYRDGTARPRGGASSEYYADDYDYSYSARIRRFHQPSYRGLGLGYYDYAYTDYYWYNPSPFYYGYDIYGRPWGYDPFWGPSWSAWGGPAVSINLGWGNPWGGYYNPYRPWGWGGGYNRGFYDGYYSGYYGNNWGWRNYRNSRNWGGFDNDDRNVNRGPRRDRAVEAINAGNSGTGRPRVDGPTGGRMANTGTVASPSVTPRARGRVEDAPETGNAPTGTTNTTTVPQPGRGRLYRIVEGGSVPTDGSGRTAPGTTADQPANTGYDRRRNRIDEGGSPASEPQRDADYAPQPRPRRERAADYSSPAPERPRSYDAPQRSYEAPQRSYEAPTRSYDRGNSSSGGSNSGSSGGGRSRGRVE
ncbi:hypothetical protein D3Y59_14205 [Hymenobacter oligotrophus]|uniref:Uncharacterized protein n=1 Tax=Hymenobacter oligotrophus TaxID=2319843 RepID=A0A3B7RBL5_9BACT|nr:hypothetical protein [Hymenobacter oligotrophus]AYA38089.1 hypothetical protein D3Y59_14205 [Hymenobacter oligotrophus]